MYHREEATVVRAYKIVLVGDSGCGKSCFADRLVNDRFDYRTTPTVAMDLALRTVVVDGTPSRLRIWDTAGQERYFSLCSLFYRDADCMVFMYDTQSRKSFYDVKVWLQDCLSHCPEHHSRMLLALVGNKTDLGYSKVDRVAAQLFAIENGIDVFDEVSAKDGSNIDECIAEIVRQLRIKLVD
jgi:small GTP-binding protein